MTVLERVARASSALKVFPLPGAVLFPHTLLPLNIFEPRYRALVKDSLASDRVMAIAALEPGWQPDYQGRPAMQPILCTATIEWHEHHDDGRYTVLLQGITRGRIVRELPATKLYREVEVELLPDPQDVTLPGEELLRQAALEVAGRMPGMADEFLKRVATVKGAALADVVAGAVIEEPERRQELLSELDVGARFREVLEEVSALMASLVTLRPSGLLN